jgi:hypothetical protein
MNKIFQVTNNSLLKQFITLIFEIPIHKLVTMTLCLFPSKQELSVGQQLSTILSA